MIMIDSIISFLTSLWQVIIVYSNKIYAFIQEPIFYLFALMVFIVVIVLAIIEDGHREFINDEGIKVRSNGTPVDKELRRNLNIGGEPMHWTAYNEKLANEKKEQRKMSLESMNVQMDKMKQRVVYSVGK